MCTCLCHVDCISVCRCLCFCCSSQHYDCFCLTFLICHLMCHLTIPCINYHKLLEIIVDCMHGHTWHSTGACFYVFLRLLAWLIHTSKEAREFWGGLNNVQTMLCYVENCCWLGLGRVQGEQILCWCVSEASLFWCNSRRSTDPGLHCDFIGLQFIHCWINIPQRNGRWIKNVPK